MNIKYHYCLESGYRLAKFLKKFQIKYDTVYDTSGKPYLCSFDLYDGTAAYLYSKRLFPLYSPIPRMEYTEHEISKAEWLTVKACSWRVKIVVLNDTYTFLCPYKNLFSNTVKYRHAEQRGLFGVEQPVKWKNTYFSGPDTADNLIFCSQRGKQVLGSAWDGLKYTPVLVPRTGQEAQNVFQLQFTTLLPRDRIYLNGTEKKQKCRKCGKISYCIPETYQLAILGKGLAKECVYTTGDMWCYSKCGESFPQYIVSSKFYNTCKQKGIIKGLVFTPVVLV